MKLFSILLLICSPCLGDEMLLRDGRKLSWKSIADDGESYSVQTKDGKTVSVRKTDVERLSLPAEETPVAAPLTGAQIAIPAKQAVTVDLLLKADVQRAEGWKLVGRTLVGSASWPTRAPLTFDYGPVPEEYDLTLVVERGDSGNKDFDIGVVGPGGALAAFHLDCYDGTKSCLALIGGAEGEHAPGGVFRSGKPRTVRLLVRRDALLVQLDGKDLSKNKIDWKQVSLHPAVKVPVGGRLFVVAAGGSWKVHSITLTSTK